MKRITLLALMFILIGCGPAQTVIVQETVLADRPVTVQVPITVEVPVEVQVPVTVLVRPTALPTPKPTATPEAPEVGTMQNPVPVGTPFSLILNKTKKFNLTVTEVYRGAAAWQRIIDTNQFNDPPPDGKEYVLIYLEVDYYEGPSGEALELDWSDLDVVSNGQIIEYESVVEPDPDFDISFFPGAKGGGWIAWLVFQDDPAPLLAIGMSSGGSGGFFFSLTP